MAKLRRLSSKPVDKGDGYGRVYVHKIELDNGTVLHKVGMCESDRTVDRMMEILRSFFMTYRYVPYTKLRKDKKTLVPRLLEKHMHKLLDEYRYNFDKKFDGCKEFFLDLDENVLLDYLDKFDDLDLLKGVDTMETKYYNILSEEYRRRRLDVDKTTEGSDELQF